MTYSQQHAGPKKICAAFTVVDSSGVELSCTLRGHFATTLFNYLNGRTNIGPVVIIIKHGKIKDASDGYAISIGNAWNGTKVFIDADYDDAKFFAKSVGSTQGSTNSQFSGGDRFLIGAPIIQFSELMNLPENTICITMATTRKILTSKHGWYYKQCDHCPKKTDGHAPPYKCLLGHPSPKPVIKFKLDVEVFNGDDKLSFIFWDHDCVELVGITAPDLRQLMIDVIVIVQKTSKLTNDVPQKDEQPISDDLVESSDASEDLIICAPQITPKKRVLDDVNGTKIAARGSALAKTKTSKIIRQIKTE
ncbi:hypothetical protein TSUD_86140 [Trifolium subterraneum]|uniref:Replication factor A C-terminal domain-containing protein n=1 Tax=Trifolium subterraneum TaxID=3900 RepID=A0A2Z6NWQ0_TRISU|nr:hypothetical protein TSUD_86140 [Trifolium subterraneum]